ncbi:MAG TPA: GNAT family N-acetyltransferase [Candidatus Agrococcus pullicola]|uniref:GNAT family N-acetyltransferase n=1 Tax=Candidatus Agrococcus pullicola TaxID=2838429 RepID=A0A9D1YWU1_9MICO|nr:GNAT family N-acetyltransferase [Candidatus Agrococcus pullicola]
MSFHDNPVLQNDFVRLEPLTMEHAEGIRDAVRDGELWKAWYTFPPRPEEVEADIERRFSLHTQGTMAPWTIVDRASDRIVGQTTFMNINALNRRVEIGSTWLAASTHGTKVNPAAKLLLLTRAFEELDCIAVEFRTHWHNRQSRAGIEKLGAKLDGVLRNHEIMTGGQMRDTAVYSILPGEWPTVKLGLEHRLEG